MKRVYFFPLEDAEVGVATGVTGLEFVFFPMVAFSGEIAAIFMEKGNNLHNSDAVFWDLIIFDKSADELDLPIKSLNEFMRAENGST